jgi:hypothetical protein
MGNPADSKVVEAGAPKSGRRRRVLTGAVGATSVLMTIGSRPVLGTPTNCMSMSVWQSVQAGSSVHGGCTADAMATGYSPDVWMGTTTWPAPYSPG